MRRLHGLGLVALSLGCGGCLGERWHAFVNGESRATSTKQHIVSGDQKKFPQASLEAATRVDTLSRQIVAANPKLGFDPVFLTIGDPKKKEIFHRGREVFITEGLVSACAMDAELAAVLSMELGRIRVEEAAARTGDSEEEASNPLSGPRQRDGGFSGTSADQTELAERALLAKQGLDRPIFGKRAGAPPLQARPEAEQILRNAGFNPTYLKRAEALTSTSQFAESFEQQINAPQKPAGWQH